MQELLSVMKTMSPEQIVEFMSQLFVWLDDKTQEMFVAKVSQLMWAEQWNETQQWADNMTQNQTQPTKTITPEQKRQAVVWLM